MADFKQNRFYIPGSRHWIFPSKTCANWNHCYKSG